jgi:Transposase DDE domain group 1
LIEREIRLLKLNLPIVGGTPAMVDATPFLPGLSPVQGKAVIARFDGGRLSSEGGLLVLREVERRLGLADRLAACLKDPRGPEKVVHRLAEIIRFRMPMIAAGYEDGNDADTLRRDPMFKLALDRLPSDEELSAFGDLAAGIPA